ncbi:MAG: hypothetical protein R3E85_17545 [Planctomycetota bacterium]
MEQRRGLHHDACSLGASHRIRAGETQGLVQGGKDLRFGRRRLHARDERVHKALPALAGEYL